jgi:hypothetical protein
MIIAANANAATLTSWRDRFHSARLMPFNVCGFMVVSRPSYNTFFMFIDVLIVERSTKPAQESCRSAEVVLASFQKST